MGRFARMMGIWLLSLQMVDEDEIDVMVSEQDETEVS